ncbi:VOC family protein [Natrialbaceae archaeon A-CW1-1]
MDVIHTSIWVSDLQETLEFLVDGIGLKITRSFTLNGVENVYVGGTNGEIQLRYDPERPNPEPDRAALDHIAIAVNDVDTEVECIVDRTHCNVVDGPTTVDDADARVAFLEDPDGYVIELVESVV